MCPAKPCWNLSCSRRFEYLSRTTSQHRTHDRSDYGALCRSFHGSRCAKRYLNRGCGVQDSGVFNSYLITSAG